MRIALLGAVALAATAGSAFAASGWSPPHQLTGEHADAAVAASNASGDAVAAWYRFQGDPETISLHADSRQRNGGFTSPVTLGAADLAIGGNPPSLPSVAVDDRGDAVLAWLRKDAAGNLRVEASYRPRHGHFGAAHQLSAAGAHAFQPMVAVDGRGDFTVVWQRFANGSFVVQEASRNRGQASFGAPTDVSVPGLDAEFPAVGVGAKGRIVVVWQARDSHAHTQFVQGATREPHHAFGTTHALSNNTLDASKPRLAVADDGSAMAAWDEGNAVSIGHVAAAFSRAGHGFGAEQVVTPAHVNQIGINAHVGIDRQGKATLVWLEIPAPGHTSLDYVRAATGNAAGHLVSTQTLFHATAVIEPAIGVSSKGAAAASWVDLTAGSDPLYAAVRTRHATRFGHPAPFSREDR